MGWCSILWDFAYHFEECDLIFENLWTLFFIYHQFGITIICDYSMTSLKYYNDFFLNVKTHLLFYILPKVDKILWVVWSEWVVEIMPCMPYPDQYMQMSCKVLLMLFCGWWGHSALTHWGRVTHICVSKLTIIGSDNGLSPGRRQAINWTNAGILLIRTLGTNFSETLSEIRAFSFNKMHLKISSAKWRPFCLGLNVLAVHWKQSKIRVSSHKPSHIPCLSSSLTIFFPWPQYI